jgi:hypothetical protein
MMKGRMGREILALLPWIAAAVVWFGLVSPMRAEQEARLSQQSRIRRDRVKTERDARETQALRARIGSALGTACRASSDPAALRQRAVAASDGLSLASFALTVTGGPEGGATVDASGTRVSALELLRRLGDPARGGFLRGASIREKGGAWVLTATTGVLESLPAGLMPERPACSGAPDTAPTEAASEPQASKPPTRSGPPRPPTPSLTPAAALPAPTIEPAPGPPFTLVAFLVSAGKSRVSIRVGDEVRMIAPGDEVDGWKCVSIDRDEGVVFTSPAHGRVVLKPGASER